MIKPSQKISKPFLDSSIPSTDNKFARQMSSSETCALFEGMHQATVSLKLTERRRDSRRRAKQNLKSVQAGVRCHNDRGGLRDGDANFLDDGESEPHERDVRLILKTFSLPQIALQSFSR